MSDSGRVAFITGGASGIGEATAKMLAAEGDKVVLGDINLEGAQKVASDIGDQAIAIKLDITSEQNWADVIAQMETQFGKLDVLVNSAGVAHRASIMECTLEEFRRVHTINVEGVFLGCKAAMPLLEKAGMASIINLSSVSGIVGGHNLVAYNSSKGAVRMMSKSIALHCAKQGKGVRCNSVHPVFIKTPMVAQSLGTEVEAKLVRQIPIRRLGEADEVAAMIRYLASPEAAMVTGAEFVIDGGLTAT